MKGHLISVIVPVYKVEKYIDRCIKSIVHQTYKNLEIILVDDGSPDQCGKICDQWAQKDSRIVVIHKKNGGLSDARNVGTRSSQGEYITYIDSDDFVSPDYVQYLKYILEENCADISCCGMVKAYEDTADFSPDHSLPPVTLMTGYEACEGLLNKYYMKLVTAWGKLYKREIVLQYPFPKGRKFEDEATTGKFYYQSTKVALGNQCLYGYFQNPESITHTQQGENTEEQIWALLERSNFFENHKEKKLTRYSWSMAVYKCIIESLEEPGKYDKYWVNNFDLSKATMKLICQISLYKISPVLYSNIKNTKTKVRDSLCK